MARFLLRFVGFAFTAGTVVFIVVAAVAGVFISKYSQDLPDYSQLKNYEPPVMTRVHAGDGAILAEHYKERRLFLPIQAVPKLVVAAFLSAEDKNFYRHNGVDPEGIARAGRFFFKKEKGQRPQGASTITQQVAKNFLLSNEQTFERKIKEILLAIRIENTYTKDKILELYLNEIYLGLSNYGIAAAALNYYGKSVHELTIAEAAYLAALPKAPSELHPFRRRDRAMERRNYVVDRMVENGYIAKADGEAAKQQPLGVSPRVLSPHNLAAGYFAEEVRREIAERYGERKLYEGGLSVRTTLDPAMQTMARKALVDGLVRYDENKGWHGAVQKVSLAGREWGAALMEVPALGDIQPWRLGVVLESGEKAAKVGLQPKKDITGQIVAERETGAVELDGIKWTRKPKVSQVLNVGDVVYVEPMDGKPGQFRLRQIPEISGAIVVMDPNTGRVFAMVGGFSFDQSEFNRATQAQRQPGSSFKPIVYAAALDNGYTPSSIVLDSPITIETPGGESWTPSNYDGKSTGPHTLRYGIEMSKNLMTVRLARDVGMPLVVEYAKRLGSYDDMLPLLPMALGAGETTVMRQTAAYSMFVNGGKRIKPTLIDRIQDRWGRTIYKHDERGCDACDSEKWSEQKEPKLVDKRDQVLDPFTAYQITSILEGVVQRGTATGLKVVGKPLAGKTGTTNEAKDVWFVGFSPDLAVGVFLGYDKPQSLGSTATGGLLAVPIFRDFMTMALKDKPATPFRVPPGIKLIMVDRGSGMRSNGGAGSILEAFKPGTAPPESSFAASGFESSAASAQGEFMQEQRSSSPFGGPFGRGGL
jgi:penicillin-binding protein 1A